MDICKWKNLTKTNFENTLLERLLSYNPRLLTHWKDIVRQNQLNLHQLPDLFGVPFLFTSDISINSSKIYIELLENAGAFAIPESETTRIDQSKFSEFLRHIAFVVRTESKSVHNEAIANNFLIKLKIVDNLTICTRTTDDMEHVYRILNSNCSQISTDKSRFAISRELFASIQHTNQLIESNIEIIPTDIERIKSIMKTIESEQFERHDKNVVNILSRAENITKSNQINKRELANTTNNVDTSNFNGFIVVNQKLFHTIDLPIVSIPFKNNTPLLIIARNIENLPAILNFAKHAKELFKDELIYNFAKLYVDKPFESVLVANRGEIAVRIIRTLKRLKVRSIAIYSKQDEFAAHVLDADQAVFLGGHTLSDTYLNMDKIIGIALTTKAEAIIPGYGFLSENPEFAERCIASGITFVGPLPETIRKLGLKHSAREIARQANVPLCPGSGLIETLEEALSVADKIGYPLMVKSSAGGGGIGLQKCENKPEMIKAFTSVRHLGQSYFNDSRIFIERYVDKARHIEIQIMGNGRGDAYSLGERDCSLQRRNQKVIEETPAPNLPERTRKKIRDAAVNLAKTINYKCAGTVEFIYDERRNEFYFLEVNTRLQVEHTVTEEITGLDLVEWMLWIAADVPKTFTPKFNGTSIEARVYAENPVKDFVPSPGQLLQVSFPEYARVDTWIKSGTHVTADYDPMIAKIIVHGKDRKDALFKLQKALRETTIFGIVTNLDYLREIVGSKMFESAAITTNILNTFKYMPRALEILAPGSYTTVQDYPGRVKLWHIGVPPSGPMDDYAFRMANRIVGNAQSAAGIEITLLGPTIYFHTNTTIALTGGQSDAQLDDVPISFWTPVQVKAGQKLAIGKLTSGCRSYLAIQGGIDVPEYLGSRSTFALGNMGGFNGRVLKYGDILMINEKRNSLNPTSVPTSLIPRYEKRWEVGVLCGPHGAPDFFQAASLQEFIEADWKVHYNSNRFGVRLTGPKPKWARENGGEAGLHPSNAHDYVYPIGGINFTGDDPVILTCDGPSLGGFVCPFTVAQAEMWKIGQVKPGDLIRFKVMGFNQALALRLIQETQINTTTKTHLETTTKPRLENPVLCQFLDRNPKVYYRQSGDRYILIEYGDNVFDLTVTYRIYKFMEKVRNMHNPGIVEMSPGVRSVLIQYDGAIISQQCLMVHLMQIEHDLGTLSSSWKVPSRVVRLPFAFEDDETLAAVKRYQETIRSDAPWLPNNVDFLTKINRLGSRTDVENLMYAAKFMVLGLGDVFLGAPCAVPLDPRHRLVGTKYNPSRTYTPNGTVGIGGMYMCIYTMESPGGYQLVGRTLPIWDKLMLGKQKRPWLLNLFDQIEYYPVTQTKLAELTAQVQNGTFNFDVVETTFDYGKYKEWIDKNHEDIARYEEKLMDGTEEMARLIQIANEQSSTNDNNTSELNSDESDYLDSTPVYSEFVGRVWKQVVEVGQTVTQGQALLVIEAMKAELSVTAPKSSKVLKILVKYGDFVESGDVLVVLE